MNSSSLLRATKRFSSNTFRCSASQLIRHQSSAALQPLVLSEVNDSTGFATVQFNRLPMSNFTLELLQEFSKALDEIEKKGYKGMILTSTSPSTFSAGLDLKELLNPDEKRLKELRAIYIDCCVKLYGSLFPTVAAINGHAIGGGCFLAMACEYRIMTPKSKIGLNETQLGIAVPKVAALVTKDIISSRNAELALTLGTVFTTEEALDIGLIDEIATDKSDAITRSEAFLKKFRNISSHIRGNVKRGIRRPVLDLMIENHDKDIESFVKFVMDPGSQQSLQAFLNASKNKK